MSIDMNTKVTVQFDDGEPVSFNVQSWQDVLKSSMEVAKENGFGVDAKREKQIMEMANFGRVTL